MKFDISRTSGGMCDCEYCKAHTIEETRSYGAGSTHQVPTLKFSTLTALVTWVKQKQHDRVILDVDAQGHPGIEIYDDYRE